MLIKRFFTNTFFIKSSRVKIHTKRNTLVKKLFISLSFWFTFCIITWFFISI